MMFSIPAASSKMQRSDPPAAASISPTGTSPSRCAGSEIAQPSSMLISVQLRKRAQVLRGERLVVGEVGDFWRRVGGGRQHQRVIGRDARLRARDERASRVEHVDVVGRAHAFAAQDADVNAGIVDVALADDQIAVPGKAFRRRKAALGVHRRRRRGIPAPRSARSARPGATVSPVRARRSSRPHRRDHRAPPWSAPPAACP